MCGRYSAAGNLSELAKFIEFISRAPFFAPRYNIAPRQQAPVIIFNNFQPELKLMRWGLIPPWAKDEKIGDNLINTRAETISEKISFKKALLSQRCLIPADGFFEWQRKNKEFTPFRFTMRDNSFFCFAGIYEKWIRPPQSGEFIFDDDPENPPPSQLIETFSIITTEANEMVSAVHGRMPVILDQGRYLWWLDARNKEVDSLKFLFRPYSAEEMDCYRVSKLVNNAKNDSPECLLPGYLVRFKPHHSVRLNCATRRGETKSRRAAGDLFQALNVFFDLRFVSQTSQSFRQDFFKISTKFFQTVVHPFSITPRIYQASLFQIRQVT